jgi:hypothetical protein
LDDGDLARFAVAGSITALHADGITIHGMMHSLFNLVYTAAGGETLFIEASSERKVGRDEGVAEGFISYEGFLLL